MAWSAAAVEILRHVYADEAPLALEIALVEERGMAVAAAAEAAGPEGARARLDAAADLEWAWQLRTSHADLDHLIDDRYWNDGAGFDISARLVDLQVHHAAALDRRPDRFVEAGDRDGVIAQLFVGAALPLVAGYLLVELLLWRRGGAAPVALVDPAEDVDLVPRPWGVPAAHRYPRAVALAAWVLVSILPLWQVQAELVAERASAQSSRAAVQTSTAIAGGAQLVSFQVWAQRDVLIDGELHLAATEWAVLDVPDAVDDADAETFTITAHRDALPILEAVTAAMIERPSNARGVDERLAEVAGAVPDAWRHLGAEQVRLLDISADAGRSAGVLAVALLLAALALSLAALAATPTAPWSRLVRAAPALLVAGTVVLTVGAMAS